MHTKKDQTYVGINHDLQGGMTPIGKIIRDAKVFDLISETETCEGWTHQGIDALLQKVNAEWDKHGCLVSNLPEPLFEKHQKIHAAGMQDAIDAGWTGDSELLNET